MSSMRRVVWIVCWAGISLGCAETEQSPLSDDKSVVSAVGRPSATQSSETESATVPVGINTLESFDADLLHYSHQGSGFFPMSVVRALKDSQTGRPFLENLERFGLVPGEKSPRNPEGFPVGIVTNKIKSGDREIEMFGFTCAACHTSDLHYQGKVVRVEGGSGLFYVDELGDAIGNSLKATLKEPEEFWAFLHRLTKDDPAAQQLLHKFAKFKDLQADGEFGRAAAEHIKQRLETLRQDINAPRSAETPGTPDTNPGDVTSFVAELSAKSLGANSPLKSLADVKLRQQAIAPLLHSFHGSIRDLKYRLAFLKVRGWLSKPGRRLAAGYGRADDFGTARVELFAGWNEKNMQPVNAPVSTPPLWNVDKYEWLHWNANSNSVIQRSIGEAIGVGATYDAETLVTSVDIVNQMRMEQQIQKLTPPRWPADVFGKPDQTLADKGQKLYQTHCAECHSPQGVNEQGLIVTKLYTIEEVRTDPTDAMNFDRPVYKSDGTTIGFAESIATLLAELQTKAKSAMSVEDQQLMDELERDRLPVKWRDTLASTGGPVYPGRMLEGIWATAPYLHNGSVPTLYHLLLPAVERPKTFLVGSNEFDPQAVGFVWEAKNIPPTPGKRMFELDTTLQGNFNTGHEYGSTLSDEDRWALIEYLKIHRDPEPPATVISD